VVEHRHVKQEVSGSIPDPDVGQTFEVYFQKSLQRNYSPCINHFLIFELL
jgi:hypothetical protein